MGHNHKPRMKLYWTQDELHCVSFYSSVMPRVRYLAILKYLHFVDNQNPPTRQIMEIRQISDIKNSKFSKLYHPTEHMAVDEVIVKFKRKVVFRQYIQKKN
jgi:hypothetical protein